MRQVADQNAQVLRLIDDIDAFVARAIDHMKESEVAVAVLERVQCDITQLRPPLREVAAQNPQVLRLIDGIDAAVGKVIDHVTELEPELEVAVSALERVQCDITQLRSVLACER